MLYKNDHSDFDVYHYIPVIMIMMITIIILRMSAGIPGVFEFYGTTPNSISKLRSY